MLTSITIWTQFSYIIPSRTLFCLLGSEHKYNGNNQSNSNNRCFLSYGWCHFYLYHPHDLLWPCHHHHHWHSLLRVYQFPEPCLFRTIPKQSHLILKAILGEGVSIPTSQMRNWASGVLRSFSQKHTVEFEPTSAFKADILNHFTVSKILTLLKCHLCARLVYVTISNDGSWAKSSHLPFLCK